MGGSEPARAVAAKQPDAATRRSAQARTPTLAETPTPLDAPVRGRPHLSHHNLLTLQRALGNRSVARELLRTTAPIPAPARVQRVDGEGGEGSQARAAALSAVASAPDVDPSSIPGPEVAEQAKQAGDQLGPELEVVRGKPELAAEFHESLQTTPESDEAPAPPSGPSELAKYQESLGGGQSEGPVPHVSNKSTNTGNTAKSVLSIGTSVSKVGASLSQAGTTMAQAGATIAAALGYVAGGIGALLGLFDIASAVSSRKKGNELTRVMAELKKANPQDTELIGAIQYALEQKYSKATTRAVKAITGIAGSGIAIGALAAGVSLVALASNPVGWVIAGVLAGTFAVVGVGIMLYKLARKIWKWWKGDLGLQRRKMAMQLYDKTIAGNANAAAAIKSLGLDPEKMRKRAAEGETPEKAKARTEGSGFKEVAAKHKRHTEKVKSSSDLVAATQQRIAALRQDLAKFRALEEKYKGQRVAGSYAGKAEQIEAAIGKEEKNLAAQQEKLGERKRKLAQDEIQAAWKSHSKIARGDIKLIERKLKK